MNRPCVQGRERPSMLWSRFSSNSAKPTTGKGPIDYNCFRLPFAAKRTKRRHYLYFGQSQIDKQLVGPQLRLAFKPSFFSHTRIIRELGGLFDFSIWSKQMKSSQASQSQQKWLLPFFLPSCGSTLFFFFLQKKLQSKT